MTDKDGFIRLAGTFKRLLLVFDCVDDDLKDGKALTAAEVGESNAGEESIELRPYSFEFICISIGAKHTLRASFFLILSQLTNVF